MAAYALARLATITGHVALLGRAYATLEAMSGQLVKYPMASAQALLALDFLLGTTHEFVIAGPNENTSSSPNYAPTAVAVRELFQKFWPNKVVLVRPANVDDTDLPISVKTLLQGKSSATGDLTVYVCERGSCQSPIVGLTAWQSWLGANAT